MRRTWIIGWLVGVAVVTAACGEPGDTERSTEPGLTGGWVTAGCEFHRVPETAVMGRGVTMPVTPAGLGAAIARIDRGGRDQHPDSYAGIEVDQQHVLAIVYRVPSAALDDFIRVSAQDSCVVVRDAAHGLTELTGWHDRIVADLPMWADRDVRITSVNPRHDGIGVEVGTDQVARTRSELLAAYGRESPLVFVEEGPATPLAGATVPPVPQPGG